VGIKGEQVVMIDIEQITEFVYGTPKANRGGRKSSPGK
jgi:hypothetical protein